MREIYTPPYKITTNLYNRDDRRALMSKVRGLPIIDQLHITQVISNFCEVNSDDYPVKPTCLDELVEEYTNRFFGKKGESVEDTIRSNYIFYQEYINLSNILGTDVDTLLNTPFRIDFYDRLCVVKGDTMTLPFDCHRELRRDSKNILTLFLLSKDVKRLVIPCQEDMDGFKTATITLTKLDNNVLDVEQYELYAAMPYSFDILTVEDYETVAEFIKKWIE